MLHIHFGTGRLGLGLVAPFFQAPGSELYLFNRAVSGGSATGSTAVNPERRNELLLTHPRKEYVIATPEGEVKPRERVQYDGFFTYEDSDVEQPLRDILERSQAKSKGVIVTASVLTAENYAPVIKALNFICQAKAAEESSIGNIYLIACENTVSACEVMTHEILQDSISNETRQCVRCVPALVDRVCVELEEAMIDDEPTLVVRAEEYGSLKLELCPHTEQLPQILEGSKIQFSRHLDIEKEIKNSLLNGSHWLIALTAFQETGGRPEVKLNEFIQETENHHLYASEVVNEMRDGVEALLRSKPKYADFVRDVDVTAYLDGAAQSILGRFEANSDTISRILARFRAPCPDEVSTVQKFIDRFLHRIEEPLQAYQEQKGLPAKSASQGLFNLFRLQASGTYIDSHPVEQDKAS
ncbi:hypothetical protein ACFQDN_24670 [Pseudomonas asuensis]|uniref:Mannitol dehydrogenase C-terminal domain-containing protein n=1 Tax=Pseudomonas asuensis TaxID=1825787 RepID=A0ABQ2GZ69_9PSED|nr:hypothetical protein [Pseudomonas asuensis]GGM19183.1 hypothetical protein GCM10009425_32590 [Pseudomonas asuensis]